MAIGSTHRDCGPEIARWAAFAQTLADENAVFRAERDRLLLRVEELEAALDAAKAELVRLTLVLRHESERSPRPEPAPEPEAACGDQHPSAAPERRRRGQQPGAPGHGRRRYDHLETTEEVLVPSPEALVCPTCGRPYQAMAGKEDSSEELSWKVSITRVIHRRPRYTRTCACPGTRAIVTAPPPPKVIPKGRMSAGMLARLLVAKYVVGTPCSRLAMSLGLEGADLAPGTMAGVLLALAPLLAPLAAAIRARNAASELLHVDETSWPVFVEVVGKANHRWWLWVFVGPVTVAYVVKSSRGTIVVAEHLGIDLAAASPRLPGGRPIVVCSDFFTSYQSLGNHVAGVTNSWCWAHIRRHFVEAGKVHPAACGTWADAWVARIGAVFSSHRRLAMAAAASPEESLARAELTRALAEIDAAREAEAADASLPRAAAKVLATLGREWEGLVVPITSGSDLDNNAAERALRSPVVGRKNYYGSGATWSAALAADAWSITATTAMAGWNPLAHLEACLCACAANGGRPPQGATLEAFLPWGASPGDARVWSAAGRGP